VWGVLAVKHSLEYRGCIAFGDFQCWHCVAKCGRLKHFLHQHLRQSRGPSFFMPRFGLELSSSGFKLLLLFSQG